MYDDEILREVRAAREAYAASHNFDLDAMVADLNRRNAESGRTVVSFPPRPPRFVPAPVREPESLEDAEASRSH